MKFKNTLIAATLLLSITSAQAALVESDWQSTGDALATLDTDTGIEWLDLTQTLDMSINQAESLTGAGSIFEGWRLPTRAEVAQMMTTAFASEADLIANFEGQRHIFTGVAITETRNFQSLFGIGYNSGSNRGTRGQFKNDPGQTYQAVESGVTYLRADNRVVISTNSPRTGTDYDQHSWYLSVYLVSDGGTTLSSQLDPSLNSNNVQSPINNVSAPALLGLMSLGLFGFTARNRSSILK
jgi:hypothetical protein